MLLICLSRYTLTFSLHQYLHITRKRKFIENEKYEILKRWRRILSVLLLRLSKYTLLSLSASVICQYLHTSIVSLFIWFLFQYWIYQKMTYLLYVQILLLDVEYARGNMGNSRSQRGNFKLALAWTPEVYLQIFKVKPPN